MANGPYSLIEADRFFRRKAEEYSGSIREWDEIVAELRSNPPMALFYSIDDERFEIHLLDLFLLAST